MQDLDRKKIDNILDIAAGMEKTAVKRSRELESKIMATLFFEPSTRTRLSFESAMLRLGGSYLGFAEAGTSSAGGKGETLADTIRTVERYADVIVIRHPLDGSARVAAEFSSVPVINAGSGSEEHPTQALLDLYSIRKLKGKIDGLSISLCGDLKYGRTVHSLGMGLSHYDVTIKLAAPQSLRMKPAVIDEMKKSGVEVSEVDNVDEAVKDTDVVYMTRIQKERFPDIREYDEVRGRFSITEDDLPLLRKEAVILHPLPRVDELSATIDATPHAKYFDQVYNGVILRMAVLKMILS
jgi:aspartate carbamoyltransferase catalytic subunit